MEKSPPKDVVQAAMSCLRDSANLLTQFCQFDLSNVCAQAFWGRRQCLLGSVPFLGCDEGGVCDHELLFWLVGTLRSLPLRPIHQPSRPCFLIISATGRVNCKDARTRQIYKSIEEVL